VLPFQVEGQLTVALAFGFDADSGQTRPVISAGQAVPSALMLRMGDVDWNGTSDAVDDYCTMTWDLDGRGTDPVPQADDEAWFFLNGLQTGRGAGDCENPSPEIDILATFEALNWQITVGGDVDPVVEPLLERHISMPDDHGSFFGGTIAVSDFIDGALPLFGQGFETDADGNVLLDGQEHPLPIAVTDIPTAQGLASAWYEIHIPWLIALELTGETFSE